MSLARSPGIQHHAHLAAIGSFEPEQRWILQAFERAVVVEKRADANAALVRTAEELVLAAGAFLQEGLDLDERHHSVVIAALGRSGVRAVHLVEVRRDEVSERLPSLGFRETLARIFHTLSVDAAAILPQENTMRASPEIMLREAL